jgi:hypothetical protein
VFGVGTPGSRSEERRRAEGVLDPLAEIIGVTPGGQADPHAPREKVPVPAVREVVPSTVVTSPGQAAPPPPDASGVRGRGGVEAGCWPTLGSVCGDRGPRGLPAGTIGLALERVSIRGHPCFIHFSVYLDFVFSFFQQAEVGLGWSGPHEGP